jgi:SAM-dependent MidA family methyltransferase
MESGVELPAPSAEQAACSEQLAGLVREAIDAAGGAIPFSQFMELCLYTPGLGYYSGGQRKFGTGGDFVTAPEISPLFGRCLARPCEDVLETLGGGDILEFGAGSGQLAADLLGELQDKDCLPERYLILERSAELRQRQQQTLHRQLPQLGERVSWIDTLPEPGFRGVVLANEVLDAMAVERFRWQGTAAERFCVGSGTGGFEWRLQPAADTRLAAAIAQVASGCDLAEGYVSEINLTLQPWLQGVADCVDRALLLLIDYGYPRSEYYHPQRSHGTLMCHYRHRAHPDPLLFPGLQDITAHVDFTAVAEAGVAAGLDVCGYTSQSWFLLDCGLDSLLQAAGPADTAAYLQQAQQAKTLILPGEMGERFKCIGLTRGIDMPVPGFRMQDQRGRL